MGTLVRVEQADVLTDVLESLGVRGRLFCHSHLSPPWGLAFRSEGYAHFHVMEEGRAWLTCPGVEKPVLLERGDLVLLPHGSGHQLADPPEARAVPIRQFLRQPGAAEAAPTTRLLCGSIVYERGLEHPLLAALPPLLVVRGERGEASRWVDLTLRFLSEEAGEPGPGTEAVVSHLAGIVFVQALRAWLAQADAAGWAGALRDRQVAHALALIHRDYAREWSIPTLARQVGLSRTAFAARFTTLVGEPPAAYLTRWRLQIAATRLRGSQDAIVTIAEQVGYQTEAALSKAFKRHFGVAPGAYRRSAGAMPVPGGGRREAAVAPS